MGDFMKPMYAKKNQQDLFLSDRFARTLADNLSWGVDRQGHKVQLMDKGGFVFDLDEQGRIVQMKDSSGKIFKYR